jgi:hypothetical protein
MLPNNAKGTGNHYINDTLAQRVILSTHGGLPTHTSLQTTPAMDLLRSSNLRDIQGKVKQIPSVCFWSLALNTKENPIPVCKANPKPHGPVLRGGKTKLTPALATGDRGKCYFLTLLRDISLAT